MNQELNDLFEVDNITATNSNNKGTTKHIILRILALVIITGTPFLCMLLPNMGVDDKYGLAYIGFFSPTIWFAFIIIETIILQIEKNKLRNVNLILFLFLLFLYLALLFQIA